jgi:endonuclease I
MLIKLVCIFFSIKHQNFINYLDAYCVQLLENGNTKAINDLVLCGYTEIINQLKANVYNNEDANSFINNDIPQLTVRI